MGGGCYSTIRFGLEVGQIKLQGYGIQISLAALGTPRYRGHLLFSLQYINISQQSGQVHSVHKSNTQTDRQIDRQLQELA